MSSEATPISPARFAEALKDLPLSTLHLKAAELHNSIAHLDYSNEQLQPFAAGTDPSCAGVPDNDCIDAIKENEIVIARMTERISLLKAEVESRGSSWLEFQTSEELTKTTEEENLINGTNGQERSAAWRDGTFQTGRIVNGEVRMDGDNDSANGVAGAGAAGAMNRSSTTNGTGGTLDDDALRQAMADRMRSLAAEEGEDEGEGGMHL